ncbi:integrase [Lysobacteraceae bacterium NML95-0200]|nr:integrase [Xanthomonadaceae bacterium NML95-0200]
MPLTDTAIRKAKDPGKLADGGGLYLLVKATGGKWWRLDYRRPVTGKRNTLSLGTYPETSLAEARAKREDAKRLLQNGIDPGQQRKAEKLAGAERAANTFEALALEWLEVKRSEWMPSHHEKQAGRLRQALPWIGHKAIADIGIADLRPMLEHLKRQGATDQTRRIIQNVASVFDYAITLEKTERNPARDLLPAVPKHHKKNFPAIKDPARVGELLRAIDSFQGSFPVACALQLAPLWFCRPGELRAAEWAHIDLEGEHPAYTVPAAKRKLRKAQKEAQDTPPHIVPLSRQAVAILQTLHPLTGRGRYLFPGARDPGRCLSDAALNAALANLGFKGEMVAHGFRHMASTLLHEMGFSSDAIEAQLSHKTPGVRGVYNKAQYLPERRKMMQAWADYLDSLRAGVGNVVAFKRSA